MSPSATVFLSYATAGAYMPPGWVLFIREGTLVGRRFDLSRGELTGDSVTIADPVAFQRSANAGAFSVSDTGSVIYRSGGGAPRQLTWFDRSGKALGTMGAPDQNDLVAHAMKRHRVGEPSIGDCAEARKAVGAEVGAGDMPTIDCRIFTRNSPSTRFSAAQRSRGSQRLTLKS